jgi:hypothetical protein
MSVRFINEGDNKKMSASDDKTAKLSEAMAASSSKSAFVEKLVFAGLPILASAVAYLLTELNGASSEITTLKAKIAIVVNQDNKAIPPQGTTIDMAQIRESLNSKIDKEIGDLGDKIDKVEKDAALARANMTLDREKQLAMLEKQRMEMNADAASARSNIRADAAMATQQLKEQVNDRVDSAEKNSALARAELDKRITILEFVSKLKK